ncbi:hypothetical protein [Endozoicomonas sp. ALB115]|uniref:hypothetical protein n=1 Tax=Endozoicomonas sp. ALB115 TaxID=3403074 RepID=UPI003BB60419
MHASLDPPSGLRYSQLVGKKDAASQTEGCCQVTMPSGRAVSCAQPSPPDCPDTDNSITTADKSLSDYGVKFAREVLQIGQQGSNKLIRSVAGFTSQHVIKSGQFPVVFPDIKQILMFLAAMPALAGAHPMSTRPTCPDGVPGSSMTSDNSNGVNESATSYTPASIYPTTNLTTTSEPTSFYESERFVGLCVIGGIAALVGLCCAYAYCSHVHIEYQRFKYQNPNASRRELIKAAFNNPNDLERTRYNWRARYQLPVRPAQSPPASVPVPHTQRAPVPTAPTTCEQGTQTTCEQGTQTYPVINDSPLQEQQPPTYDEATRT